MNHCYFQGRHFNFFLGGQNFLLFFNATGLLKNWLKQHFIYSNLTLFIVPFFLSFFFLFFSFFLSFLFIFFLGGDAPSPPQMTPLVIFKQRVHRIKYPTHSQLFIPFPSLYKIFTMQSVMLKMKR